MSIRKIKGLESNFTIVPNKAINDKLSWAARGMLLYLCSKPDDWQVNITDLVNQTTGTAKRSGRDAVRKIMDELVECGYMRKTQARISGKFQNVDHEVSFQPFTGNPYTVNPSTANPTQQSTDLTKYGINKESITDNFSATQKESAYFINDLDKSDFKNCYQVMELNIDSSILYNGSLKLEEWQMCEDAMNSVDGFDHEEYVEFWIEERSKAFRKTPSLPNMFCDFEGIGFSEFYEKTFIN